MTTSASANEARARRERRKKILRWIPSLILAAGIIVVIAFTLAFNGSWWREAHPQASAQQQFHGQSVFTTTGIDYSGKTGVVKISLASDRPRARSLGLPSDGSRTVSYLVPVTISVSASGDPLRQSLASQVLLHTAHGYLTRVNLLYDGSYASLHDTALSYIALVGNGSDVDAFEAALQTSRDKSRDLKYAASFVGAFHGISLHVALAGTPSTVDLTVALSPET